MPLSDTDDPIRAVGFVAIRFAHLEDELDEAIRKSAPVIPPDPKIEQMNFREKVRFLKRGFRDAFAAYPYPDAIRADEERNRVDRILQACKEIALRRNDILHRPIFGDLHTDDTFQKRQGGQMQQIKSQEIIDLANEITDLCDGVRSFGFVVGRLLEVKQINNSTPAST